jgi:rare lipoprotein A
MFAMTAAHPTLPIPSYARVTSLHNGRAVTVRVNDRGPFRADRLIDLSYVAAYKLGILADGSKQVEVESIVPGTTQGAVVATAPPPRRPASPAAGADSQILRAAPAEELPTQVASGVYLQLGAFSVRENAEAFARRARADLDWLAGMLTVLAQGTVFRVQAGPYADRNGALAAAARIEQALGLKPLVITR